MELRVAAEACFQRGVEHRLPLASSIDFHKFFHAPAIAKIHECDSGLLFEQPAQAMRAQPGMSGKLLQIRRVAFVADQAGGAFDGGMHVVERHVGGLLELLPDRQKGVAESRVEKSRAVCRDDNFREQFFQSRERRLRQTTAVFARRIGLSQNFCRLVGGDALNRFWFQDSNPHFEFRRLLDENVFLRWKQPKQIATSDGVFPILQEIKAAAGGDQIEFQFRVMVHGVPATLAVTPEVSIQLSGQFQELAHGDKK